MRPKVTDKNINSYYDARDAAQVLGCFMKNPLLMQTHRVDAEDFVTSFFKLLYATMRNMMIEGVTSLSANQVYAAMCSKDERAKLLVESSTGGGLQYLINMEKFADEKGFELHYTNLRKWSLLRDMIAHNFDVSDYYVPAEEDDDPDGEASTKRREKFMTTSIEAMIQEYHSNINLASKRFSENSSIQRTVAGGEKCFEQIMTWQKGVSYGRGRPSQIFTTVTGGLLPGKLTVYSGGTGVAKTRMAIATMCFPFIPKYYDHDKKKWVKNPQSDGGAALYIGTEMDAREEIEPILIAYMTGIPQEKIQRRDDKNEGLNDEELQIVKEATEILGGENPDNPYDGTLFLQYHSDGYTLAGIEAEIASYVVGTKKRLQAVFFDYIMPCASLEAEYKKIVGTMAFREDQMLLNVSAKLKDFAQKYKIAIETSTQITGNSDNAENRGVGMIRGSKAIADKGDICVMIVRPNAKELEDIQKIYNDSFNDRLSPPKTPNLIFQVYKNRGGRWNNIKIWLDVEFNTMRVNDVMATDLKDVPVDINSTYIVYEETLDSKGNKTGEKGFVPITNKTRASSIMSEEGKALLQEARHKGAWYEKLNAFGKLTAKETGKRTVAQTLTDKGEITDPNFKPESEKEERKE